MHDNVYSSIKLSYDYLESEDAKSLFLLCSLNEEDADILINDLFYTGMGYGLFEDQNTLEEAWDRLHVLVDVLKDHCLLLNNGNDSVKMHDIIHDVGISIACKDKHMYNIGSVEELKRCLNSKKLKDATAVSLFFDYDHHLPQRLECPQLQLIWMWRKASLKIPDNFFEEVKDLKVLDMSLMHLAQLPSSLRSLQNLQTLCLNKALVGDIAIIGALKGLKVLDLARSKIKQLPREIGELTCLCMLDLNKCKKLKVIQPNVISRLVNLEKLDMEGSFRNWEVEGVNGETSNASLSELKNLAKLTTLHVNVPKANMLPKDLFRKELKSYRIMLGDWQNLNHYGASRILKLKFKFNRSSLLKERGFETLVKRTEELYIHGFNGLKNIVYELDMEGLSHLKYLLVQFNDEIQYIIDNSNSVEHGHSCSAFPNLETLFVQELKSLEKIYFGKLPEESFRKLRAVVVKCCNRLKNLFPYSIAKQLEKIEVIGCKKMEEIINIQDDTTLEAYSEAMDDKIEFPKLHTIKLANLPEFKHFCLGLKTSSTSTSQNGGQLQSADSAALSLFNQKVVFANLRALELSKMNFEKLWPDGVTEISNLQNLQRLIVKSCDNLKYLLSADIAGCLEKLVHLETSKCCFMEEIILKREEPGRDDERMNKKLLPKLEFLRLHDLPNLTSFCSESFEIECPNLKELDISDCPKLWTAQKLRQKLSTNHDQKVESPDLELHPVLLARVYTNNLTTLTVKFCANLENLLSASMARSLVNLKNLEVSDCKVMREVVVVTEELSGEQGNLEKTILFSKLESLVILNLPSLIRFSGGDQIKCMLLLELKIENCPKLRTFICSSSAKELEAMDLVALFNERVAFPELETLTLKSSIYLNQIWHNNDQHGVQGMRSSLQVLTLSELPRMEFWEEISHRGKALLHNLKLLQVLSCSKLKKLPSSMSFQALSVLRVSKCHTMESLFTCSAAKCLIQLKIMSVTECRRMTEIIRNDGGCDRDHGEIVFENLQFLALQCLPSLTSFYSGNCIMRYPKLSNIITSKCPEMKSFCHEDMVSSTPKLKFVLIANQAVEWPVLDDFACGLLDDINCKCTLDGELLPVDDDEENIRDEIGSAMWSEKMKESLQFLKEGSLNATIIQIWKDNESALALQNLFQQENINEEDPEKDYQEKSGENSEDA